MTSLCVVDPCRDPRHHDGCPEDCDRSEHPPALAETGSEVCAFHGQRARADLRGLADIWEALGEPLGSRSSTTPAPVQELPGDPDADPADALPAPVRARTLIRSTLVSWCRILAEDPPLGRGITLPDERDIARTTRRLILHAETDLDVAVRAWRNGHGTSDQVLKRRAALERLRRSRETGRDVIDHLAEHVDRHALWLLGSEHAGQLVAELRECAGTIGIAYPRRHAVRIACPNYSCAVEGVKIPIAPPTPEDPDPWITCPGCGDQRTADGWRQLVAPDDDLRPRKLAELVDWLALRGEKVTHRELRQWAAPRTIRGRHLDDCDRADNDGQAGCTGCATHPPLIHPVNQVGKGGTRLYDPVAVLMVARQPADERRRQERMTA